MATTKLLVSGQPLTHVDTLLQRITTLQSSKAGPFDAVLCCGALWHDIHTAEQLQALTIDVPTYFVTTVNDAPPSPYIHGLISEGHSQVIELRPNLYYMRGCGVAQVQHLSIAYVDGVHSETDSNDLPATYTEAGVDKLISLATTSPYTDKSIDVLFTSQWPASHHNPLFNPTHPYTSTTVTKLAQALNVRYHLTASADAHHTQPPYRNAVNCTRFMSFAAVDNASKQKWLYAANVLKLDAIDSTEMPADVTDCPYTTEATIDLTNTADTHPDAFTAKRAELEQQASKRQKVNGNGVSFDYKSIQNGTDDSSMASITNRWSTSRGGKNSTPPDSYICKRCGLTGHWIQQCTVERNENKPPDGYICKVCNSPDHFVRHCPTIKAECQQRYSQPPPDDYICKNCGLSGHYIQACPQFARSQHKHCWFCLSSPDVSAHLIVSIGTHFYLALPKGGLTEQHALIIPIAHCTSALELNDEQRDEFHRYKQAIRQFYASRNEVCIMYERNVETRAGQHMHTQCVNMQPALASKAQQMIVSSGAQHNLVFKPINDQYSDDSNAKKSLTEAVQSTDRYVHVELPDGTELLATVASGNKRALDFMRTVIAEVMDEPDKANWKNCAVDDAAEEKLVDEFKLGFQTYDFAAE